MTERFRFSSFGRFLRTYAFGSSISWFVFFLMNNAYLWLFLKDPDTGLCPLRTTIEFAIGTAFFLGFIVSTGATVQARRGYHADRFVLTDENAEHLDRYRQTKIAEKRSLPLFARATWTGSVFALVHGGLIALLAYFFAPDGINSAWFVFALAGYFAIAAMQLTAMAAWVSIARMRLWMREGRRSTYGFWRYTIVQNALAALIVNVPLGYFYGYLKFPRVAEQFAEIHGGAPGVPPLALAQDIGVTVVIIALLFGAGIRAKVQTELMTEVRLADAGTIRGAHGRWSGWYALLLGGAAFGLVWAGAEALPGDRLETLDATIIKCAIQGLVGLGVGYWAATRTAAQMIRGGPGFNPFRPEPPRASVGD